MCYGVRRERGYDRGMFWPYHFIVYTNNYLTVVISRTIDFQLQSTTSIYYIIHTLLREQLANLTLTQLGTITKDALIG